MWAYPIALKGTRLRPQSAEMATDEVFQQEGYPQEECDASPLIEQGRGKCSRTTKMRKVRVESPYELTLATVPMGQWRFQGLDSWKPTMLNSVEGISTVQ